MHISCEQNSDFFNFLDTFLFNFLTSWGGHPRSLSPHGSETFSVAGMRHGMRRHASRHAPAASEINYVPMIFFEGAPRECHRSSGSPCGGSFYLSRSSHPRARHVINGGPGAPVELPGRPMTFPRSPPQVPLIQGDPKTAPPVWRPVCLWVPL